VKIGYIPTVRWPAFAHPLRFGWKSTIKTPCGGQDGKTLFYIARGIVRRLLGRKKLVRCERIIGDVSCARVPAENSDARRRVW